jgi:hypothetical protein
VRLALGRVALPWQCEICPPSMTKTAPLTNDASAEAGNSTVPAISSGCAARPIALAQGTVAHHRVFAPAGVLAGSHLPRVRGRRSIGNA